MCILKCLGQKIIYESCEFQALRSSGLAAVTLTTRDFTSLQAKYYFDLHPLVYVAYPFCSSLVGRAYLLTIFLQRLLTYIHLGMEKLIV